MKTPTYKMYSVHGNFHARFDSVSGLIPVKPMRKIIHKDHFENISEYVRVKVLETVGAYRKGEILEISATKIIPLSHIKHSKNAHARIFSNYEWIDLFPEYNNEFGYIGKI